MRPKPTEGPLYTLYHTYTYFAGMRKIIFVTLRACGWGRSTSDQQEADASSGVSINRDRTATANESGSPVEDVR